MKRQVCFQEHAVPGLGCVDVTACCREQVAFDDLLE
jgi:hypothetical protein